MTTSSIISKSASLLDILCTSSYPLRFTEIVARCELPKSSVHRLIAILLEEGMLTYEENTKCYRPGTRIMNWASGVLTTNDLPSLAQQELSRLNQLTDAHVCLGVLKGSTVLYLKTIDSHEPFRLAPRVGECSPIHCTAVGKAIVAFKSKPQRDMLTKTLSFEKYTEFTLTSKKKFVLDIEKTISRGFAICNREEFLQICGIAAPVFDASGHVLAAVSIWNIRSQQKLSQLLSFSRELMHSAEFISEKLGYKIND